MTAFKRHGFVKRYLLAWTQARKTPTFLEDQRCALTEWDTKHSARALAPAQATPARPEEVPAQEPPALHMAHMTPAQLAPAQMAPAQMAPAPMAPAQPTLAQPTPAQLAPAQTLECTWSNRPGKRNYAPALAMAAPMHETSAQMQGPSMDPAKVLAHIQVENMDVDNEPSSEDWNPGQLSKRGMKGKGKQLQLETDHEMGGKTDASVTRRPYRRLAKGTRTYHEPRCSECEKKNYVCEIESVKVAFVSSCFHSMSLTQVT